MLKKTLRKKIVKIRRKILPTCSIIATLAIFTSGYFYFFANHIKADYYFKEAQELDDANQYGSREAIKYYTKAIYAYKASGDRGAEVNAYIHLGLLHHKFGNILQVERMVLSAIEIGGNDIPKPLKAKAYMLLASTVEPQKAKEYIAQALAIAAELDQRILMVKSYFILAKINEYKADFAAAKNFYQKSIQIAENLTAKDGIFDMEPLYANLAELYQGEGANTQAIDFFEKALSAAKNNSVHSMNIANYNKILGDLYQTRMQTAKACANWNASRQEYNLMGKQPPMALLQLSTSDSCKQG